ncbi:hypothetical protein Hte_006510 [Hypoxylon texense]
MSRTTDSLTLPTAMHSGGGHQPGRPEPGGGGGATTGPSSGGKLRHWTTSRSADHRSDSGPGAAVEQRGGGNRTDSWWKIHLFRGMVNDVRRRAPYYWSDWRDAWDYRVVPSTIYMYFAKYEPALAFSLDMFTKTNMQYGVNEVLLASVLGAVVFAILACQPLVIVGVTGPITVFN